MTRGTTPAYILTIEDLDLTDHTLYVTLQQGCVTLTLSMDRVSVENEHEIFVPLTQEETLRFRQGNAKLQVRGLSPTGTAWATNIISVPVNSILQEGVIDYDY